MVIIRRLRRALEKNRNELFGLGLGRYPAFVRRDVAPVQIPVFQFHDVATATLETLLKFLSRNDYATLTADEYFDRVSGAAPSRDREVLLSFDDGHESLYSVAFPLLRKFGQKAVAYIVPGRVPDRLDDSRGDDDSHALCDWSQILEMYESGVIDAQSHSMYHHSIAISPQVVDFTRPGLPTSFLQSDLAPIRWQEKRSLSVESDCWGLPIHTWNARMCERPAFIESPETEETCIKYVADHGGEAFFHTRGWRRRLTRILKDAREKSAPVRFETAEEQRDAILADLRKSRLSIETRLPCSRVRHFCFPWYRGSALAAALSHEAGYVTNAWGSLLPRIVNPDETEPTPIARLQPNYIYRLPGVGRRSLIEVLVGANSNYR